MYPCIIRQLYGPEAIRDALVITDLKENKVIKQNIDRDRTRDKKKGTIFF
jgi:hypothetical protein